MGKCNEAHLSKYKESGWMSLVLSTGINGNKMFLRWRMMSVTASINDELKPKALFCLCPASALHNSPVQLLWTLCAY